MGVVAKSVQPELARLEKLLDKRGWREEFELFNQAEEQKQCQTITLAH